MEDDDPKKGFYEELRVDSIPGVFVPTDRHQRAAALDLLFSKVKTYSNSFGFYFGLVERAHAGPPLLDIVSSNTWYTR
jgi:hypothetical protein